MAQLLHKLDNNEAVLLMFLAGELPEEDRQEVEQLLASDGALRAELLEISQLYGFSMDGLRRLDEATPLRAAGQLAARRVAALVHRTHMESLAKAPVTPARQGRRVRWWHPLMATAAAILVFLIWWGYTPENTPLSRPGGGGSLVTNVPDSTEDLALDPSNREPDAAERHAMALTGDETWRIPSAVLLPPEEQP